MRGYKYLRVPLKGYDKGTTRVPLEGSIRVLYLFGGLIIRILPFRVLYWGPPFSETPISKEGRPSSVL